MAMLRPLSRLRYAVLGLLLLASVGFSLVRGTLLHNLVSENSGHVAQLRLQFTSDTARQLALREEATSKLDPLRTESDWATIYSHVQLALAPISSCPALVGAANAKYSLSEDQAKELAAWIEGKSVIPVCLARNDLDRAAAYYAWAESSVPGVAVNYNRLPTQMAGAFVSRAFLRYESGGPKAAQADWTSARGYLSNAPYERFGDVVEKVAASHRKAQQALLAQDLASNPSTQVIRIYLAQAYNAASQGQEALAAISPLLSTLPGDTRVWQQYGQALIGLNRIPEAQDALQKAVRLAPNDLQALNRLGVLYQATGQTEQAELLFRQALALKDGNDAYWVWEHLGDALAKEGKRSQAVEAYKTAVAKAPQTLGASARKKLDELGN